MLNAGKANRPSTPDRSTGTASACWLRLSVARQVRSRFLDPPSPCAPVAAIWGGSHGERTLGSFKVERSRPKQAALTNTPMENTNEKKKPSYKEQLQERCAQAWHDMMESEDWGQLYDFAEKIALESYRNGIETGKRAAGRPALARGRYGDRPRPGYRGQQRTEEHELVVEEE